MAIRYEQMGATAYRESASDQQYEFHPAADIFELLDGPEFEELTADIGMHGLHMPIVLFENKILDGRNRYRACRAAGIDPTFVAWKQRGEQSPAQYVWSVNRHRRQLDQTQRAMAAAKYAQMLEKEGRKVRESNLKHRGGSSKASNAAFVKSAEMAAAAFDISRATVERASALLKKGTVELQQAVADKKVSISAAAKIANLPAETQREIALSPKPSTAYSKAGAKPTKPKAKFPLSHQSQAWEAFTKASPGATAREAFDAGYRAAAGA